VAKTPSLNALLATPASELMSAPLWVAHETDSLMHVEQKLSAYGVSALPVLDRAGAMVGVISRSDLLRVGRARNFDRLPRKVLAVPEGSVRRFMTSTVEVVSPSTSLAEVARRMLRQHIHRLFVSEDRRPLGVVSTKEIMRAIALARESMPIASVMHPGLVSVEAGDSLALAVDRMGASQHSGLIVHEEGWPVGVFTQREALAAREASPDDRVDQWMDARVICLPLAMPLFRAAEQVVATRARRLLAVDGAGTRGIVTGMDFVRFVVQAAPS
jgi:CBS domain-containing protein